jgi:hypothetical protein
VPDQLTQAVPAPPPAPESTPPAVPPVVTGTTAGDGRPARRPSWLRAALWSLVILAAGVALGGAGYRLERTYFAKPPVVERTGDGVRLIAQPGHELSGLGLEEGRLIWQDGASIEYLDSAGDNVLLLGPGPGMRTTWQPALSGHFAVWFEAERQVSLAARLVVYDTVAGRRRELGDVGSVRSYPAVSGDLAVWCSAVQLGQPRILGARVGGGDGGGDGGEWLIPIADDDGAPVVSGGLVVWAAGWTGPFLAQEVASGTQWPVTASMTAGRLTGIALSGRTLVWGQQGKETGSGVVSAVDVDGRGQQVLASGITGLAGPSYDGETVAWAQVSGSNTRVMARRLDDGQARVVADVDGSVTEVALSGDSIAWIQKAAGSWAIVVRRLPS